MNLLVVGSIAFDSVESPFGKSEKALGGTAIYFSIAASYFTRVGVVAAVGSDFPQEDVSFLQSRGVDVTGLAHLDGETFHWGGKYHENMNDRDTLFTHLNVFRDFEPEIPESYRDVDYVFLGNIDPNLQLHVLQQVKKPRLVALDTMNYWIDGTAEALQQVLRHVDVLFVNDEETRLLSGERNILRAVQKIRRMGPKVIIVKKGEHGALMVNDGSFFYAPAFPLDVITDPTGAGDTFAGGFMGYLAKVNRFDEASLRRAMVYGSTLASFVVQDFSIAKLRQVSERDISERFQAFHRMTQFKRDDAWQ